MIRCIAIDDEPLALRKIESYIDKTPFLEKVAVCESALEAMDVLKDRGADLLFVDINMPDLSGMDFVKTLDHPPRVIFTTAYSEYAVEGFRVDALDYLLKPFGYADFLKSANKAKTFFELVRKKDESLAEDQHYLFIKSEYRVVRINFDDIKYIESKSEYVRIHLVSSKPVMSLISLRSLEEKLPAGRFMRIHRSYIVNLEKVTVVERNRVVFDRDVYIPVGEQYKERFQEFLRRNFL